MDINFEKGIITLYGKNTKIDTLLKKLSQLSGEQVYHFLSNRGITVPRRLNCLAMISVLNNRIKFLHSNSISKDYFSRLQFYKSFSEQQLFALFLKISNNTMDFEQYRYNLFKLILINYVALDLQDGELMYLKNLKKTPIESFGQYFNFVSGALLEQEDTFDGQLIPVLQEEMIKSASNQEIIDLAGKYGIDIPQRLNKETFLEFIFYYMKKEKTYNDEIAEELVNMTMQQLTTYARRTGVPMEPTMTKANLITYLFYYLEQCKIEQTSVKRLVIPQEYEPLNFTVDLSAVSIFNNTGAKKVIHYEEDSQDAEKLNEVLIDADKKQEEEALLKAQEAEKEAEKEAFEEAKEEEPLKEEEDEVLDESNTENDEPKALETNTNEVTEPQAVSEPASVEMSEEAVDELVAHIIEENRAKEEEKKENQIKENNPLYQDVRENTEFGSLKIEDSAKGAGRKVVAIIGAIAALAVIGACVWFLL